jgi:phosphate transport system substrate-binding protein
MTAENDDHTGRMRVRVAAHGTGTGLAPLLRGQVDLWMTSHPVLQSDLDSARSRDIAYVPTLREMRDTGNEIPIGLAALVVAVNARNPVPMLAPAQIRDIYTGKASSWAQVGGPSNLPIGRYSLEVGADEIALFCRAFIGNAAEQKCMNTFGMLIRAPVATLDDMKAAIVGNDAAIGFLEFMAGRDARVVPLKTACGNGIEPDLFRIKAGEYPLVMPLYLYSMPGHPLSAAAREFVEFATGPFGQAAIAASGLTDLSPGVAPPRYTQERLSAAGDAMDDGRTQLPQEDIQAFKTAVIGAARVSITFRFAAGSSDPGQTSDPEIARLVHLIRQPAFDGAELTLVGFSGSVSDGPDGGLLSRRRANAIRDILLLEGIEHVTSAGVGRAAPVGCNLEEESAALNQRVEVWVRQRP